MNLHDVQPIISFPVLFLLHLPELVAQARVHEMAGPQLFHLHLEAAAVRLEELVARLLVSGASLEKLVLIPLVEAGVVGQLGKKHET